MTGNMAPMSEGKIFISYRRADASGFAGRLFDRLSARFGEDNIFMDVEGLDPGVDFVDALESAVSTCDVLIALIGRGWLNARDEKDQRRLDNPEDFVRIEIAAGLDRDVRVIPVLVQGARMPGSRVLPAALKPLSRLNAVEIRHERFNADVDRLSRSIESYFKADAERREREVAENTAREEAEREQRARELAQQENQIADCLGKADAALAREDWQTAQSNYREILKLRPDHSAAQNGLQSASRNLELAQLYGRAILLQDEGQLARALRTLRRIQGVDAGYRDVPAMILAIENLLAEQAGQTPPGWRQRLLERLSSLPRGLWYLGGITGLILMLVLACWGGYSLLGYLRGPETPPPAAMTPIATTQVAAVPTKTNTPRPVVTNTSRPATATTTILPSDTHTPTYIDTPTSTPTNTLSPAPEGLPHLLIDDFGVSMALVSAGSFEMGSDADDALAECKKFRDDCELSWYEDEEPVHIVTLDDFYIDQYEVTNARYAECVEAGVCDPPSETSSYTRSSYYNNADFANYPVIYVSWQDAQSYCQWRNARLPTEAEWEKAARGGLGGTLYPWGDVFDGTLANYCDLNCTFDHKDTDYNDAYEEAAPVGSYASTGYGLYDMSGNVWEWTQSLYQDYPYDPADGREDLESSGTRVRRGGSWYLDPYFLRVADRDNYGPAYSTSDIGFRCVRSP